ncbi:hypothetical protein [Streptomyces sp. NPDC054834]
MHDSVARCVVPDSSARCQLGGAEAAVIVVIIIMASALALNGMPHAEVLSLLGAAGLLSVSVTRLATGAAARGLRNLARVHSAYLPR